MFWTGRPLFFQPCLLKTTQWEFANLLNAVSGSFIDFESLKIGLNDAYTSMEFRNILAFSNFWFEDVESL